MPDPDAPPESLQPRPAGAHPARRAHGAGCRLRHRRAARRLPRPQPARPAARHRARPRPRRHRRRPARRRGGDGRGSRPAAVRPGHLARLRDLWRRAGASARSARGAAGPCRSARPERQRAGLRAQRGTLELRRPPARRRVGLRGRGPVRRRPSALVHARTRCASCSPRPGWCRARSPRACSTPTGPRPSQARWRRGCARSGSIPRSTPAAPRRCSSSGARAVSRARG